MPSALDLDDGESLRRAYVDEGRSLSAIAAMAGCSYATVRRALLGHGIEIRRSGPAPIASLRNKRWLQAQASEGRSAKEIADLLGCAEGTVRSALQWAGVPAGSARDRPSALDDARLLERAYVTDGRSVRSIAAEVGCTKDAVLAALRAHGVPIRGRGRAPKPAVAPAPAQEPDDGPARRGGGRPVAETQGAVVQAPAHGGLAQESPAGPEPRLEPGPEPVPPEPPEPEPVPPEPEPAKPELPAMDAGSAPRGRATLASVQKPPSLSDWDLPITAHAPQHEKGATVTPSTPPPSTAEEQPRRSSFERSAVPPVVDGPPARVDAEIDKIEAMTFSVTLRGYDRQEVDAYLRAVARDYRQVIKSAREAVNAARSAARAPATPPPPPTPPPAPAAPTFEDIGGRVTAVLTSAAEAAGEIRELAEKEALAIRQRAREEAERLRRSTSEALAEAEQVRAASAQQKAEAEAAGRAQAELIVAEAQKEAAQVEAEARERVTLMDRTVRANIDTVIAEARRDYERLRSAQQQCIDRLASVEFLAKHARDGLSENAGQALDALL